VLFAAFTGKAALVMTRKGTPASTIHSLIYRVSEATPEDIDRVERDLLDLQRGLGRMAPAERAFAEMQISKLQLRLPWRAASGATASSPRSPGHRSRATTSTTCWAAMAPRPLPPW
jgi:hypothetical protein